MKTLTGQPIDRVDGKLKVTGAATYAAEFKINRMVYGATVQSTITKGRIRKLDTAVAEKMPGVLGVLTYRNSMSLHFPQASDPGSGKYAERDLLPLQNDRIFYNGQHVAVVLAETFEQAEHAAGFISAEYEAEDAVFEFEKNITKAYKPPKGLSGAQVQMKRGQPAQEFQKAVTILDKTYSTPVYHHNALEPHATIAEWKGDEVTVYDSTQSVFGTSNLLAGMLGIPREKVKVIALYIGGGFGSKGFSWPHTIMTVMAARFIDRPVKIVLRRQQMFLTAGRRSQTLQHIKAGADAGGKINAIQHDTISETSFVDEFVETAGIATTMLYNVPHADVSHSLIRLNKVTPCPTRAPGEAPGMFALEVAMDELARELKMDPIELRLKNYAEEDPQKKKKFSAKFLKECYQRGADAIGWSSVNQEPGSMREGNYLIGYGMATATYPANRSATTAKAILFQDGHVEILCATQDIGTGTYTILTQIAADALSLPPEKVIMKLGDSTYPKGANSGGSQVTASTGPAVRAAALGLVTKLIKLVIDDPTSPLHGLKENEVAAEDGQLIDKAHNIKKDSYTAILTRKNMPQLEAEAMTNVSTRESAEQNADNSEGKEESKSNVAVQEDEKVDRKQFSFHSFGAHFVKVKVDPQLGTVKVEKIVGVMDVGKVMNLKTAKNQIMGGMIFGIGMALMEKSAYDPSSGRIVTRDLAQYLVPVHADMPEFDIQFIDQPDPYISPLGARGIGEIGITGITAAIANAIYHATGKRLRDLPITPDKLL